MGPVVGELEGTAAFGDPTTWRKDMTIARQPPIRLMTFVRYAHRLFAPR
jgi:hypothetical protein